MKVCSSMPRRKLHKELFGPPGWISCSLSYRTDRTGILKRINLLEAILIDLAENRTDLLDPEPWLEYIMKRLDEEDEVHTWIWQLNVIWL